MIKKNIIPELKKTGQYSDSFRHVTNSLERCNKEINEQDIDRLKFKSKQQNYTDIYKASNEIIIDQNVSKIHNKSRNPMNQIMSKTTVNKTILSHSINNPGSKKIVKENVFTKTVQHKFYYNLNKKNGSNSNKWQKEKDKNNFLIHNYLNKIQQMPNNAISLKKPSSNSVLSTT